MKYYRAKMKKDAKKEIEEDLTELDKAILRRSESGADIMSLLGTGKPFVNRFGSKEFASSGKIRRRIDFLVSKGALERR